MIVRSESKIGRFHAVKDGVEIDIEYLRGTILIIDNGIARQFCFERVRLFGQVTAGADQVTHAHTRLERIGARRSHPAGHLHFPKGLSKARLQL